MAGRHRQPRRPPERAGIRPRQSRRPAGSGQDALLRRLLARDPLAFLLLSPDLTVRRANAAAGQCLGVTPAALAGTPLALFLADVAQHAALSVALGSGDGQREVALRRSDGGQFPARLSWTSLPGGRALALWLEDLDAATATSRHWQQLQAETERNAAAKTLFLATMSHEIRTPMNGMIGMLELLGHSALSAEQREMIEVIQESGRSLLSITDEILDLSKIEAGKLTLDHVAFALRPIVEDMIELVAGKARKKQVELAWWSDPALPDHFFGDPVRLKQIGLNLLSNAVKFTDRGSVILRLYGLGGTDDRPVVRFEVTDTGLGLSPEQQQRLFQPFAQADNAQMRHFGGTGLGLSICHRLTALMGGEIGVVSAVDAGSTFWVEIPLAIDAGPQASGFELQGLTGLVMDDLPESRATLASQLRAGGATVLEASDALAAEERLQEAEQLDFAVIDLPDGLIVLLPALLARLPPQAIIATLPGPDDTASGWCSLQGLAPPLLKPLRKKQLLRAVAAALGRPAAPDSAPARPAAPLPGGGGSKAILVAEDNAINRLVLTKQLRQLGFTCDMAEHGEAAWAQLQSRSYQLLLTDCIMPVLDGYDLARRIRRLEARQGGHLPIVALTANVLDGEAEKCRRAGMDDYVSKPLTLDRLAALLRKIFDPGTPPPEVTVAPTAPTAADSPIDWATLSEILGSQDPADLREVAGFFVEGFAPLLRELALALATADRATALRLTHSAKGAARNAAAPLLAEIMAGLEQGLRQDQDLASLLQQLAAAEREFTRLQDSLAAP